ncbi:glutathione hydrolase 6 [Lissotriton helveticus]
MEAARPGVRYQRLRDSEEPRVTVHLYSQSARWVIREKRRETCVRIFAAILLLTVALSLAYYQLTHGEEKQPDSQESKWAFVDKPYWNHVWDNDLERRPNSTQGQAGGLDDKENAENHHGVVEEAGHHHGDEEEADHRHEDDEEADHHHGDEEEADQHHGDDEEENGHHHDDEDQADEPSRGHTHEHGVYHHATVLTASDVCSKAGKDILTAGGNIVDAGVAAVLCLCVVHPHAAGIGGVLSAIYYNATSGHARALNAMPTGSSSRRFGIPMVLQGLWVIHQQYGVLEWAKLLDLPLQMAEDGFRIDGVLARALRENEDQVKSSSLREWFCYTNGSLKEEGAVSANPKLAEILKSSTTMMEGGALPETVVQHLSEDLSTTGLSPSEIKMFTDAMKASTVEFVNALSFELDGFHLYAAPPPASGNIIGDILKQVNRRKLAVTSVDGEQSTIDTYLHILNSSKYGYALGLGDILRGRTSNSSGQPVTAKDVASLSFADIGAHIATADSHGNVLLISVSLNSSFGSRFISSSTGILLSDFAFSASSATLFWACPVVVKPNDEDDVLGVGATGGSSVPIAVAQSIIKHIYFEKPLAEVTGGPLLDVDIGVDGVVHSFISGFSNLSEVSMSRFDKEPEATLLNRTDVSTPVLLVESHAEHVRAFGSPTACCHFDGI